MEITENTILMHCDDFIFYNSKAVFVEYIDIIRSPYFNLLYLLSKSTTKNPIFNTTEIDGLSIDELRDHYYNKRKNQNPLYDFIDFENGTLPQDILTKIDVFTDKEVTEDVLRYSNELNFVNVIRNLMYSDSLIAKQVIIYYPYDNPAVKRDIAELFGFSVDIEFRSGTLEQALTDVPTDATYVFSDINHIQTLKELDRLNLASIIIPMEYGYNYVNPNDKDSDLLLDITAYMEDDIFKFDMFLASVTLPEHQDEDDGDN